MPKWVKEEGLKPERLEQRKLVAVVSFFMALQARFVSVPVSNSEEHGI